MKIATVLFGGIVGIVGAAWLSASPAEAMILMLLHVLFLDRIIQKKGQP